MLYAFLSIIRIGGEGSRIPFIAAALFTVHPLCSEPVNYIQARHVIFYSLFSLSAAACVARCVRAETKTRKIWCGAGAAAGFLLAALSKEVGICYAVLTTGLYLLVFERERLGNRKWAWAAAGAAALAVGMVLAHGQYLSKVVQGASHPMLGHVSYLSYVLTEVKVFWKYLWLLVPRSASLSMDHGVNVFASSGAAQALILVASVVGIGALLWTGWSQRSKRPEVSFLCLWGVLAFFPYIFIQGSGEFMVEYRAYLPAMAFITLAALGLDRLGALMPRQRVVVTTVTFILLAVVCIHETRARNLVWGDDLSLWTDAAKKSPGEARVHYRLAVVYHRNGMPRKAIQSFNRTIELRPDFAMAYNDLGGVYYTIGETEKSVAAYRKALELSPAYAEAHHNLRIVLRETGREEEAEAAFRRAIDADPGYTRAHNDLGHLLGSTGRNAEAIQVYLAAIERDPGNSSLHVNLATAYASIGKTNEAVATYRRALELDPRNAKAHLNLGLTYTAMGDAAQAGDCYRKAIELAPDLAPAHAALAVVYYNEKKFDLAVKHCDEASRLGYAVPEKLRRAIDAVR
jgi:tetratricopeptide (TPR) repeat protein